VKASVISALEIEKFDIFKEKLLNLELLKSALGALVNKTLVYFSMSIYRSYWCSFTILSES